MEFPIEQVRSNKDASEGREEVGIAEKDLPDLIVGYLPQVVCRLLAGYSQINCLLVVTGQFQILILVILVIFTLFPRLKKRLTDGQTKETVGRTDGRIGRTDGRMDSHVYRD